MADPLVVAPSFLAIEREALVTLLTVRIAECEAICAALPLRSPRWDGVRQLQHHLEMARLRLTQDPAEARRLGLFASSASPAAPDESEVSKL